MWTNIPCYTEAMRPKYKNSSVKYLVVLALLSLYVASLVLAAIRFHIDGVWLFYGLIPSTISVYLALHGYHESQHAERHLRTIAVDIAAVRTYVESIVGLPEEFDQ